MGHDMCGTTFIYCSVLCVVCMFEVLFSAASLGKRYTYGPYIDRPCIHIYIYMYKGLYIGPLCIGTIYIYIGLSCPLSCPLAPPNIFVHRLKSDRIWPPMQFECKLDKRQCHYLEWGLCMAIHVARAKLVHEAMRLDLWSTPTPREHTRSAFAITIITIK